MTTTHRTPDRHTYATSAKHPDIAFGKLDTEAAVSGCAARTCPDREVPHGVFFGRVEEDKVVELPRENMDQIVKRLRRAQGQIGGILKMIDEGRDCEDIVTQVAAASRALDRAGFAIISTGLKQCLLDSGGADSLDSEKMEKLFLSLA